MGTDSTVSHFVYLSIMFCRCIRFAVIVVFFLQLNFVKMYLWTTSPALFLLGYTEPVIY